MATITIRNLEEELKKRLRVQAAERGRSMEEEAREILRAALAPEASARYGLGTAIHDLFAPVGGIDLDLPPREASREPPEFD